MKILHTKIHAFDVEYTNREEFKLLCDEIFNKGIYNIKLNKKPSIIDTGAHVGLATLYFKSKYPDAHIIAFEPNPNIFPILEENMSYNGINNVELYNIALGKKEEVRTFYIDDTGNDWFSTSGFIKNSWKHIQSTVDIKVKVDKLSKYIRGSVDLLKMDIEGAEGEVLEELDHAKKLKDIRNIIIEFHPVDNKKPNSILKILKSNGFDVVLRKDPLGDELIDIKGSKTTA